MTESHIFNILLVDDDDFDIMAFDRALKKTELSINLTSANVANEALDILIDGTFFDCIFLDYQLPGTNGLKLLKQIREIGVLTPVAILTSQGDEKLAVEMMKTGAFDYFQKSEVSAEKISKILHSVRTFQRLEAEKLKAEKELKHITRNLEEAQEIANLGSWEFDVEKQALIYWSNESYKLFGIQKDEGLPSYERFLSLVHPKDFKLVNLKISQSIIEKKSNELEFRVLLNDGTIKWLFTKTKPIINSSGEVVRLLGTSLDISNRKKSEEELIEAKRIAEAAAKTKSEFLSNMSHEIRTPMNAILGLTDLLLDDGILEGKNLENLKSIKYSADNLLVIINEILDFSKIEAGKISFESIDFSLQERLNSLVKTLEFKASEKGINFVTELDKSVPKYLVGDPYRLNQILLNLAGNAIKFTSEGEVKVKVKILEKNKDGLTLSMDVSDTGIGISEQKQESIFESFTQAYTDTTRNFGGTGLGLAITKKLVELQGGEISLSSVQGEGSTFTVNLPFKISTKESIETNSKTQSSAKNLSGYKILVAEDNIMNQLVIRQILSKWNADLEIVQNGQEVLDKLIDNQYNIILMDLQMPIMSGYDSVKNLRLTNTGYENIPVVALTADAFPETKKRVLESGFNDFITKPFDTDELYSIITDNANK